MSDNSAINPSEEELLAAVRGALAANPDFGRAKLLAKVKTEKGWTLSEARLKRAINIVNGPATPPGSSPVLQPPVLPKDAWKAQEEFRDSKAGCLGFILYGRGEYDYHAQPNAFMGFMILVSIGLETSCYFLS